MAHFYDIEYTDTFAGEANYSWVRRAVISVPDLAHYGYTGGADGSYTRANKAQRRAVMRAAKAEMGLTGVRGEVEDYGDSLTFRPRGMCTVLFATFRD